MIVATGPLMAEPTLRREGAFRSKFEEAALLTRKIMQHFLFTHEPPRSKSY